MAAIPGLILVSAFFTPPPHDVHTPGGTPVQAQFVSDTSIVFSTRPMHASQSLDAVRCELWRIGPAPTSSCPDSATLASRYFGGLKQTPKTLYVPWRGCIAFGVLTGFNAEYLPGSRTLVLHCYTAEPLLSLPRRVMMGVAPQAPQSLLLVSSDSIPAGNLTIVVDYRVERLMGDESTEFPVAIATI
jgi:hypothetical protein